jgi:hypothetical protein
VKRTIRPVMRPSVLAFCFLLARAETGRIGRSRKVAPCDGARPQVVHETQKYKKVHCNKYRDLAEARASIGELSLRETLHSTLGYRLSSSSTTDTGREPVTSTNQA